MIVMEGEKIADIDTLGSFLGENISECNSGIFLSKYCIPELIVSKTFTAGVLKYILRMDLALMWILFKK